MDKKKSLTLVVLISLILIISIYQNMIFHLNGHLFAVKGDGFKNYFNFMYHIKHDATYFSFDGMNYPYGESVFYTDLHPLLSNILKFISENVYDISGYGIGILNSLMFISLIVSAVFLFLIFDHYKFSWYVSVIGSVAVTFFSSNALLWQYGHYALSYSCFFPIAWYLILKYQTSDKKILFSVLILFNTLLWFYTHNYLGLIILGFTFGYHLFSFIFKESKLKKEFIFSFFLQVIIPAIFVYAVIYFSDTHSGRIYLPFTDRYRASVYSVFFPNHSYLKPVFGFFFDLSPQSKQSWCNVGNYVGITTELIIIVVLLYIIYNLIFRKTWIGKRLLNKSEQMMLYSSLLLLLFSMAIPARYGADRFFPDSLKQFVALGRFAWPFFYVIIIVSFLFVKKIAKKKIGRFIMIISALIIFSEGLSYHFELKNKISRYPNIFNDDFEMIGQNNNDELLFSEYQAVIPIPYYHKYISLHSYKGTSESEILSMTLSYKTGLPLMSAILSRPSVSESRKISQIFLPGFYEKDVINKLNKKDLLIVYSKQEHSDLEGYMLERSKKIFSGKNYDLYKLPVDSLSLIDKREVSFFLDNKDSLQYDTSLTWYKTNNLRSLYYSFDGQKSNISYRGNGSLQFKKDELNLIFKSNDLQIDTVAEYIASFWYYNRLYDQTFNTAWIEIKDSNENIVMNEYFDPTKSSVYDHDWAYNEVKFKLKKGQTISLLSKGTDLYADSVFFDELMIRPVTQDLYKTEYFKDLNKYVILKNNKPAYSDILNDETQIDK